MYSSSVYYVPEAGHVFGRNVYRIATGWTVQE